MNLSVKTHVFTDKTLIFTYLSVKSTLFADILNIPLSPGGWHLQNRLAALDPIPRFAGYLPLCRGWHWSLEVLASLGQCYFRKTKKTAIMRQTKAAMWFQ